MKLPFLTWLGHRITGFRNYRYPATPALPPKPWHPDGDEAFTTPPSTLHPNSAKMIAHLKATGGVQVGGGSTRPNYEGIVWGYPLNRALPNDRVYVVSREAGPGKLWVQTGYPAPYGARFRYRSSMMVAGNPAQNVVETDCKLHVYDDCDADIGPTITEVQNFYDFGNGVLRCDGVTHYSLDISSFDARGSSAADLPLAEHTLRYDDLMRGWRQRASMGLVAGRKGEWVHPAMGSDAQSLAPDAPPFGLVLRLKAEAMERLEAEGITAETNPQAFAVMECYRDYGAIMVDSGGNNSTRVEPDNRWSPTDMGVLSKLTPEDFEVWIA